MINLTPTAATKVKEIMSMQNPVPTALRVAVVGGGCSGFQYHMAFENQTNETDEVLELVGLIVQGVKQVEQVKESCLVRSDWRRGQEQDDVRGVGEFADALPGAW